MVKRKHIFITNYSARQEVAYVIFKFPNTYQVSPKLIFEFNRNHITCAWVFSMSHLD